MVKKFFRFAAVVFVAAVCTSYISAQDTVQQVLIPKEVFVGDTARIEYSFRSPVDLFTLSDPSKISGDTLVLDVTNEIFTSVSDRCTITNAVLIRNGLAYNFVVDIIPWKPGVIDFPEFDLSEMCRLGGDEDIDEELADQMNLPVDLEPITIASITQKLDVTNIRPPASPIVLPGTNYAVWSLIILVLIVLFLIGLVIVKLPQISKGVNRAREKIGFYKNSFMTKRRIRNLIKLNCTDVEFAEKWQIIMKDYLEYRFSCSFASVTSTKISMIVSRQTGEMLSAGQENAVDYITSLFIRTDYIKFANGSIDSQLLPVEEHEAVFGKNERRQIIEMSESAITRLEVRNKDEDGELKPKEQRKDVQKMKELITRFKKTQEEEGADV